MNNFKGTKEDLIELIAKQKRELKVKLKTKKRDINEFSLASSSND
jgi:hypothetical protein